MRIVIIAASLGLAALAGLGACTDHQSAGAPTTVTSEKLPHENPGNSAPASPATSWTTEGGPANPGAPSSGSTVDPKATAAHDGGVW